MAEPLTATGVLVEPGSLAVSDARETMAARAGFSFPVDAPEVRESVAVAVDDTGFVAPVHSIDAAVSGLGGMDFGEAAVGSATKAVGRVTGVSRRSAEVARRGA